MYKRLFPLCILLLIVSSSNLVAQRISYPELVRRSQVSPIFVSDLILPSDNNEAILAFTFRFNYDFLPFKKIPFNNDFNSPEGSQFYTTIRLNSEIFEGEAKRDLASMKSVSRDFWTDTLFAKKFEDTQSRDTYASGSLSTKLKPGTYNYLHQLTLMQERNERSTQRRDIHIPDLTTKKTGEIILVRDVKQNGDQTVLELMNMNQSVPFAKDFYALIRIPSYSEEAEYTIQINEARVSRRDTTAGKNIHTQTIASDDIFKNSTVRLQKGNKPSLLLSSNAQPFTYAVVKIPNQQFENSTYLLTVLTAGEKTPVAKQFFKSYWAKMPASLYNLDIAIDMLKYIVSEQELKNMRSGSDQEKQKKFTEFWKSKDPTPNTVFNELMAEYYRRIDYAFAEFGSQENPMGHENDQGEIYIKFGPPKSKERLFPTNEKVREVWKYPNRTFVFEASTGFGDFVLIGGR